MSRARAFLIITVAMLTPFFLVSALGMWLVSSFKFGDNWESSDPTPSQVEAAEHLLGLDFDHLAADIKFLRYHGDTIDPACLGVFQVDQAGLKAFFDLKKLDIPSAFPYLRTGDVHSGELWELGVDTVGPNHYAINWYVFTM